jgi:hypothetical protein
MDNFDDPDATWLNEADLITLTTDVVKMLTHRVEQLYANNYITSLFKNTSRCRDLVSMVCEDLAEEGYKLN